MNESDSDYTETEGLEERHEAAVVPVAMAGLRLDQALARLYPDYSRSRLSQWVKEGRVLLDGATPRAARRCRRAAARPGLRR
jgi:23S rRNA pseudouridine1911/1915/1917 synthase